MQVTSIGNETQSTVQIVPSKLPTEKYTVIRIADENQKWVLKDNNGKPALDLIRKISKTYARSGTIPSPLVRKNEKAKKIDGKHQAMEVTQWINTVSNELSTKQASLDLSVRSRGSETAKKGEIRWTANESFEGTMQAGNQ